MRVLSLLVLSLLIVAVTSYSAPSSYDSSYEVLQPRFSQITADSSTGSAEDLPKDFKLLSSDPHKPSARHSDRAIDPTAAIFGAPPAEIYEAHNKKHLYDASIQALRQAEADAKAKELNDAALAANRTAGNSTSLGTPANAEELLPVWGKTIRYLNNIETVLKQFDQNATQVSYHNWFHVPGTALSARLGALSQLNTTLGENVHTILTFDEHLSAINNPDKESELWLNTKWQILAVLQAMHQQLSNVKAHVDNLATKFEHVKNVNHVSHKKISANYVRTLADELISKDQSGICGAIRYVASKPAPMSSTGPAPIEPPKPLPPGANGQPPAGLNADPPKPGAIVLGAK